MEPSAVAQVRRFNRTVTQRVGALDDAFLSRGRPLGHSRVLWEIGPEGSDVRGLRARLDLDSGYLSRVLRALEQEGLVVCDASPSDGRVRVARLTAVQQGRMLAAMAEVERLLQASMIQLTTREPDHPHARYCVGAYFAELAARFDGGFDPARSLPASDEELVAPAGLLLVASLHDEPVGCVALKFHGDHPTEVKRMWVARSARGLGLGRRLLVAVEELARANGARTLRLETNRALTEAISLYRSAGYREVPAFNDEPFAHHWFEKDLDESAS